MKQRAKRSREKKASLFDVGKYLHGVGPRIPEVSFREGEIVFAQGDTDETIFFVQHGNIKLTTVSKSGKEAVIAILDSGDFFGEGCLTGQIKRLFSATAVNALSLLAIPKKTMSRMLHEDHDFSDRFISHMLKRNLRVEEDLVDQLFNSTEKRL